MNPLLGILDLLLGFTFLYLTNLYSNLGNSVV